MNCFTISGLLLLGLSATTAQAKKEGILIHIPALHKPPPPPMSTTSHNPQEHPCQTHSCPSGQTCMEQTVNCFVAPCHPMPTCVGSGETTMPSDPCQTHTCPSGQVCTKQTVNCLQPPCPPMPSCRALMRPLT